MSSITFSGLATGIDTASMVDRLVEAEKAPATALAAKQSYIAAHKNIISSLSSALSSLTNAVKGLDLDSESRPQTASVSDGKVGVAVSAGATSGPHSIRVTSLAAAQVNQSRTYNSAAAGAAGAGGLEITVAGETKAISWTASDSLGDIAQKINAAKAGVTASVVKVDDSSYRLVVTAKDTGTAKAPTFVETGNTLGLSDAQNVKRTAADAMVTIDGIDIKRSSNTISDALAGVTLTLKATHAEADPDTTAQVSLDQTALNGKVEKIVDAFNLVNTQLKAQLDYTGITKGPSTLFGDSTLRQMQSALAAVASAKYGDETLASIGITRDKTGRMSLDTTKLADAVASDPDVVSRLFTTGGFATAMTSTAERYTQAGGILATKTQSLDERNKIYTDQIDRVNKKAEDVRSRLEKQFAAMEKAISDMKAQSAQLSSMLVLPTTK